MNWAIFVSGRGTNLQNVLDLERDKAIFKSKVVAVVADKPCEGIERAKKSNKQTLVISPKEPDFDSRLLSFLESQITEAIFLLGYMRILKDSFLTKWKGPIVNLHPSALPDYPGTQSIERAFKDQVPYLGVTLHEVIAQVDAGPLLRQITFPRDAKLNLGETEEKVHLFERKIVKDYLLDLENKT